MLGHIVCGGPNPWVPEGIEEEGYLIGVDAGALFLAQFDIKMDHVVGDFDSVSELDYFYILSNTKTHEKLVAEKDDTDLEAAIKHAIDAGCDEIIVYGATGGRIDHQIAAQALILKFIKQKIWITLMDELNIISILPPDEYNLTVVNHYQSFFAVSETVKNLTITGVKYELKDYDLAVDDPLCISNEALSDSFYVKFTTGYLMWIQSNDERNIA